MALLADVAELTLVVARRDLSSTDAAPPPASIRPLLRFRGHLSSRAVTALVGALDGDAELRSRVAESATEDGVGRAGWLFLHRPEGWADELAVLTDAAVERSAQARSEHDERSARRRVVQLEHAVEELRDRLASQDQELARSRSELDGERAARRAAMRDIDRLQALADAAVAQRDEAVADLGAARVASDERLTKLRRAESELARVTMSRQQWSDPVEAAVADARAALGEAGAALDVAAARLRPPAVPADDGAAGSREADGASGRVVARKARRVPLRLQRGAVDGTVEATDQLLRTPGVQVLVDGYNVTMEGWPHLDARTQRERLVSLLTAVSARSGADVAVVFDGDDDGARPSVTTPLAVRVHYSPHDVEADDVIIAMAHDAPSERGVVVVSSDRRVADGVRRSGANVVSSSALLAWDRR